MNSPTDLSIPDVQNSIDGRHLAIDKVGIKAIRHPVKVADKSEGIRAKIVQGRIDKLVNEKALTTQDYIKDTTKTVEEFVKEATAELGEKISIRRFQRFNLGEGIEKKVEDFAAEVAAQMGK